MSVKVTSASLSLLAAAVCVAGAHAACTSTANPPFADNDGGNPSASSSGASSSGGSGSGSSGSGSGSGGSSGGGSSGSSSSGSNSGSSSGSSSGSGAGSSSSGSSSGTTADAGSCNATVTAGAIMFASTRYLASGTIGSGGYAYAYSDSTPPPAAGTSTACVDDFAFCGMGTTGAQSAATYGAGIGVDLNHLQGSPTKMTFAATGAGIAYSLSALPTGLTMRVIIDNAGVDYCAAITAATGMILWSSFFTQCYNLPGGDAGAPLGTAPATATHINFQVNASTLPGTFNFCVKSLKFM